MGTLRVEIGAADGEQQRARHQRGKRMMQRIAVGTALFGLLSGLLPGCSDSRGGSGGDAPLTADQFAAAAATGQCAALEACCALDQYPYDEQRCLDSQTATFRAIAAHPDITFDPAAAQR